MGIWVELRCERRGDGRAPYSGFRCWSDDNNGPGDLSDDNQQSVISTLNQLSKDAITAGWKKFRGEGWVCPACLAYEKHQQEGL